MSNFFGKAGQKKDREKQKETEREWAHARALEHRMSGLPSENEKGNDLKDSVKPLRIDRHMYLCPRYSTCHSCAHFGLFYFLSSFDVASSFRFGDVRQKENVTGPSRKEISQQIFDDDSQREIAKKKGERERGRERKNEIENEQWKAKNLQINMTRSK